MKKIDTWLDIQRYVGEASRTSTSVLTPRPDVEVWARLPAQAGVRSRRMKKWRALRTLTH